MHTDRQTDKWTDRQTFHQPAQAGGNHGKHEHSLLFFFFTKQYLVLNIVLDKYP